MPNPQDWYFLPTYLKVPRYMYVLIHLLGQKLNMCSHTISLLLLMVLQTLFLSIRMPNYCACAHTDRLDQFTNLYFGFSFRSGSSGLAGQFQVVEREFYQAWQASPPPRNRPHRESKTATNNTGSYAARHDLPSGFCTAVQSSSSTTTCDFYSCISIRLLRWHIRS